MADIHFERRKKYKSFSIILSIIVILVLVLFIPQMLISRTKTIIRTKLEQTQADTSFVKLIQAGYSYLETADAFVIFRSTGQRLRQQLDQKALERFNRRCQQIDSTKAKDFCQTWSKILNQKQLLQCPHCEN